MKAAADLTGSPETEKYVKFAQSERAQKKLSGHQLPPALKLRRYAALLVAADRYTLVHELLASDAYSTVAQVYQEEYGFDAHADSDTVQKVLGRGRQIMPPMGAAARRAAKALSQLIRLYQEHEPLLPASLKRAYPRSRLEDWHSDLERLSYILWPRSPASKSPKNQTTEKPLTRHQACLLWWAHFMPYSGRWPHMADLSYLWSVSDIKDLRKESEGKSPTSLQRDVQRLRKQHPRIPDPMSFMPDADRHLFPRG